MSGLSRRQFMQTTTAATLAAMLSPAQSTMGDTNRPLNLLMICVDDLNSWIGCLGGHPQVKTPNLDRLAHRGLLFTNAHCAGPICNPARAALLTGRHPSTTGLHLLGPLFRDTQTLREAITLPQHLMMHGYRSMGAGKVFHGRHDPASYHEFGGKFGEYGPRPPQKIAFPKGHPLWDWGVYPENDQDTPDHKIADWAIARLQQTYTQPFFLSAGFYRPHAPMFAPQKWFDLYPIDSLVMPPMRPHDLPPQRISDYAMQLTAGLAEPRHSEVLALGQFAQAVRSYLACVSFVDHQIGRVIEALDNSPHAANTLIVFWADHGFHVGTKERWGKRSLWEESTRVPLIFAGPGVTPGRCHRTVGTIDLYPTLLSQLKLPAREGLDGHDFTRLIAQPDAPWNGVALTSFSPGNHAVRDERYRYIRYADGSEELYDHETDPHEWNNLAGQPGTKDMVDHLSRYMPVQEPPLVANSSGGDSPLLP